MRNLHAHTWWRDLLSRPPARVSLYRDLYLDITKTCISQAGGQLASMLTLWTDRG